MHIVRTDNQLLKIVPRSYTTSEVTIVFTNKTTNQSYQQTITPTVSGNHIEIASTFAFTQDVFYYFVVSQGGSEIYRGNIFCTDQADLEEYTVNQGQYETYEKANANEYITI